METKRLRFIIPLIVFFATMFSSAKAQTSTDLSAAELSSIVQKCVDLSGIQSFYPVDGSGNVLQVNVVSYPFEFPTGMSVSKAGSAVNFISNASFSATPVDNYFMFRRIQHTDNTVTLSGHYYYTVSGSHLTKAITIDYANTSGTWTITNSTIN